MKKVITFLACMAAILAAATAVAQPPHDPGYVRPHSEVEANKPTTDVAVETGTYTADWNNLAAWECPQWFRDAKFGIWAHWDPQCEAEDGDWYARSMYGNGGQRTTFYNYFGHYPDSDWGYKDFCHYWTIANWDPAALIDLYYSAGARYFMAMGQHHDNYDCWDSPYQEWNSMNIGPGRDILDEWATECSRVGMKLGVSMHGAHAWTFFEVGNDADKHVTKAEGTGKWWQGYDPQELYAQNHDHSLNWSNWGTLNDQWDWGNGVCPPTVAYMQKFQNRVLQCINKYNPDMLYFDDTVLPFYGAETNTDDQYSLNILKHYYNHSAAQNDGVPQVVVTGKKLNDTHKAAMLWDIERGTPDRCQDLPWQTCTCLGDWHYSKSWSDNNRYKSAETVIRMLIDIVSKNGNLLLSVPVRGDGTIDTKERNIVNGIKAWMDINSKSIHGTRPWKIFGEGPAAEATYGMNGQGFNEGQTYTSSDVRYVTKNGKVYATIMAWPAAGDYRFKAFGIASQFYSGTVTSVKLLDGSGDSDVTFTFDGSGLTVQVPSTKPNNIAPVFEITLEETTAAEELSSLITYVGSYLNAVKVGNNSGNYTQASADALSAAITTARAATSGNEAAAADALRTAFANFEANGQVPGGKLVVVGTDLTTSKLVEASNFSATSMGSRFGTPVNWTVENFSVPQRSAAKGTKNGIDNYPGYNCLMLGLWTGDDASTSSDLANSRIYRQVRLPAGHYFFGASYNTNYQLGNAAYIFVASSLLETAAVPSQAIAYHQINQDSSNDDYYGVAFNLDTEQDVYLGWQVDLNSGSDKEEFRAKSVELIKVDPLALAETQLESGGSYKIYWENGSGSKFYLKNTDGGALLTATEDEASTYMLYPSPKGSTSSWYIVSEDGKRFTNGPESSGNTNEQLNRSTNNRDVETQMIYAQADGVYAVRATTAETNNTATYVQWGKNTFWTVKNVDAALPNPAYTINSFTPEGNYIWHFEKQTEDYTQLFGADESNTKKIFEDKGPWAFYKSRPAGTGNNGYTDGCNYNNSGDHYKYYHSDRWEKYLQSDGSFEGGSVKGGGPYYSIASGYQNKAGEKIWFKVSADVTVDASSACEVYIDFYTQNTGISGNHLNIAPFYRMYVGGANAHATTEFYIRLANNGCVYIVPDYADVVNGNKGKFNSLTVVPVRDNAIPNGALKYDTTLEYTLNVSSALYSTLVLPFNAAIPEGLTLYQLTTVEEGDKVYGERLESLEANKPVLVKAESGGSYTFRSSGGVANEVASLTNKLLTGTYEDYTTVVGDYVLQNHSGNVAFYRVGSTTHPKVKPFRAYIANVAVSAREALFFDFDGTETTGIESLTPALSRRGGEEIYDLQGRKVANPQKGLYIINGKKVIIK